MNCIPVLSPLPHAECRLRMRESELKELERLLRETVEQQNPPPANDEIRKRHYMEIANQLANICQDYSHLVATFDTRSDPLSDLDSEGTLVLFSFLLFSSLLCASSNDTPFLNDRRKARRGDAQGAAP